MAQVRGKVKWFNLQKGYGFVTDENGNDTFVHASGISEGRYFVGLNENDEVTYEVTEGKKGPQAENVVLVKAAEPPANATTK